MALQNVPHRLITDRIAQVGESPYDAIIAPRTVLAGYPHHQIFNFLGHARTPNRRMELRALALVLDAEAAPGQDRIGLRNGCDLCEGLLAQLLTDLGQCFALMVSEVHAPGDLLAENAILGCQVRMTQPELFVNRCGNRPQQFLPVHYSSSLPRIFLWKSVWAKSRGNSSGSMNVAQEYPTGEQCVWIF